MNFFLNFQMFNTFSCKPYIKRMVSGGTLSGGTILSIYQKNRPSDLLIILWAHNILEFKTISET